jgi:hypothetical protein
MRRQRRCAILTRMESDQLLQRAADVITEARRLRSSLRRDILRARLAALRARKTLRLARSSNDQAVRTLARARELTGNAGAVHIDPEKADATDC